MDEDKDTKWDLPIGGVAEENLDKSTDDALKKVGGEPITTDIGTDFEHTKRVSLDEGDDSTSEDLAFINEQIKQDEKKTNSSISGLEELPKPPSEKADNGITFSDYSDKHDEANKIIDTPAIPKPFENIPPLPEILHEKNGSLAELAEKFTAKKAELLAAISKSQEELDKITEIEDSIKELQEKEASLIEQANGLL